MVGIRRLTDGQLASAILEIDDPMTVERLALERPDPDLLPEILFEFHRPSMSERVWCCHCQARRPRNGFVIENETGNRYLIGSTCGPKYYELSFAQAQRQHEELKQRRGLRVRIDAIVASTKATLAVIDSIFHSDGLRAVDAVRSKLAKHGGDAYYRLGSIASRGGALTRATRVRDYAAEAGRPASSEDDGPIYTYQDIPLGPLAGTALLIPSGDVRDRLLELKSVLQEIGKVYREDTDGLSTTAFQRLVRRAEEARERASEGIVATRAAPEFFEDVHLRRLVHWAEPFTSFDLMARDGGLEILLPSRPPYLLARLGSIDIPDLPGPAGIEVRAGE